MCGDVEVCVFVGRSIDVGGVHAVVFRLINDVKTIAAMNVVTICHFRYNYQQHYHRHFNHNITSTSTRTSTSTIKIKMTVIITINITITVITITIIITIIITITITCRYRPRLHKSPFVLEFQVERETRHFPCGGNCKALAVYASLGFVAVFMVINCNENGNHNYNNTNITNNDNVIISIININNRCSFSSSIRSYISSNQINSINLPACMHTNVQDLFAP